MKRRDFIRASALASGVLLIPDFLKASSRILSPEEIAGKRLVVIQLSGGNDGLNTVVPFENDLYYSLRKKLALPKKDLLSLSGGLGLHSQLSAFKAHYDKGELAIINNVGYPNPDRSHFRATDIWHTASNSNEFLTTGWLGRYLDKYGKVAHQLIETDSGLSLAAKGDSKKGLAVNDAKQFYLMTREDLFASLADPHAESHLTNLSYLYKTLVDTASSADYIYEKSKIYTGTTVYPTTAIGKQLKTTASFICSGLETSVYYVSHSGFDTHVSQLSKQASLLSQLNEALGAFTKELKEKNQWKNTLVLIFSEFGRRVQENSSGGTDHGTANNVFLLSGSLKKSGVLNELPNLTDLDENGDLKFKVDFRSVYATILQNWMGADSQKILLRDFEKLGFV